MHIQSILKKYRVLCCIYPSSQHPAGVVQQPPPTALGPQQLSGAKGCVALRPGTHKECTRMGLHIFSQKCLSVVWVCLCLPACIRFSTAPRPVSAAAGFMAQPSMHAHASAVPARYLSAHISPHASRHTKLHVVFAPPRPQSAASSPPAQAHVSSLLGIRQTAFASASSHQPSPTRPILAHSEPRVARTRAMCPKHTAYGRQLAMHTRQSAYSVQKLDDALP